MPADAMTPLLDRKLVFVTGKGGTGKTTVAFQRIRFLYDQQGQRDDGGRLVPYTPELTRVFLANDNLANQAKGMLANQLDIPTFVVESVGRYWLAGSKFSTWSKRP